MYNFLTCISTKSLNDVAAPHQRGALPVARIFGTCPSIQAPQGVGGKKANRFLSRDVHTKTDIQCLVVLIMDANGLEWKKNQSKTCGGIEI